MVYNKLADFSRTSRIPMAMLQAGIPTNRLIIALEPEAASLCCRYLPFTTISSVSKGFKPFTSGAKYLVLDAGGKLHKNMVCVDAFYLLSFKCFKLN